MQAVQTTGYISENFNQDFIFWLESIVRPNSGDFSKNNLNIFRMNETSSGVGTDNLELGPVSGMDDYAWANTNENVGDDELINKYCSHLTMQDAIEDFPITKEDYIYSDRIYPCYYTYI